MSNIKKHNLVECKGCGELFLTRKNNKHCSKECRDKTFKAQKNKEVLKSLKCVCCGKAYHSYKKNTKYCSRACSIKAISNKSKIEHELHNPVKYRIFERDGFRCSYCGKSSFEDGVKLVVDHVYPQILKGDNNLLNLTTSCQRCNSNKHFRLLKRETIFKIWKKNAQLNMVFNDNYFEMLEQFNKIYKPKISIK